MHVVLVEPQIAPNTGNLIRLCANTGVTLHLIEPLGFDLDDRLLRRAGLDYHEFADMRTYPSLGAARQVLHGRWFCFSGHAERRYTDVVYTDTDVLMFGREQTGLTRGEIAEFTADQQLTIPMRPNNRSLNLANAVAVVTYEAWRQRGFEGAAQPAAAPQGLTAETPAAPPFDPA